MLAFTSFETVLTFTRLHLKLPSAGFQAYRWRAQSASLGKNSPDDSDITTQQHNINNQEDGGYKLQQQQP